MKLSYLTIGLVGLGLIGLSPTRARSAPKEVEARVSLAGAWKLNRELSEDPARKMMEAMRNAGGGGGMRGPGGGGGGMRGPGGGGGMGGGGMGGVGGRGGGMGPGGGGGMRGGGPEGRGGPGGGLLSNDEPPLDGNSEMDGRQGGGQGPDRDAEGGGPDEGRGPRRRMRGPSPSPVFHIEQDGDNLAFRTDANLRLLHSDGEKRKRGNGDGEQEIVARFLKGSLVVESRGGRGGKRKETYTLRPDGKLEADFDISGSGPMPGLKFKLIYDPVPEGEAAAPKSPPGE